MSQQKKKSIKLLEYKDFVSRQVDATLNNLSKAKQDQGEALAQLFDTLRRSVLRQIQRTYKKFLLVIEDRIGILHSTLVQANKQILLDDLDVFTLQNVHRFTKRINQQADKSLMSKFQESVQKLQKFIVDSIKDIDINQNTKIKFSDTLTIQKVKNIEFNAKPLGLDLINNKIAVWGKDLYSYDGRNNSLRTSQIIQFKSIKLYDKEYALIVHKEHIDIWQAKTEVLLNMIDGHFSQVISVVSTDDLVYLINPSSIMKFNLSSGEVTTKHIGNKVIDIVSKTLYFGSLAVSFRFGQVGLFNSNLQLIWTAKYFLEIQKIMCIGEYMMICSKSELYINSLYSTIFKKCMSIDQICPLNSHSVLLLGNQSFIMSLATLQMRQIKFKVGKKNISNIVSNGTLIWMTLGTDEVVMFKIQ